MRTLLLLPALLLPACTDGAGDVDPRWRASQIRASDAAVGFFATPPMAVADTADTARATGRVSSVSVETSRDGSTWDEVADVDWVESGPFALDLVMVADNSGSEAAWLDEIIEAISEFGDLILTRSPDDRVGLVRVSTVASVLTELTSDAEVFAEAAGEMYENEGWTALWDGIRLGNEVLEQGALVSESSADALSVCVDEHYRALLTYTDGDDNNSADEHDTRYEGDGIDTTLEDVEALTVHEVATPVHTVAVGAEVDVETLEEVSSVTGGRHVEIDRYHTLRGTLQSAASAFERTIPVCFVVEDCDAVLARVTVETLEAGESTTEIFEVDLPPVCR
ncbi:MAG: VWA domain-containing protein [Deltaproteobacteria bacterium]|nr:VWA domain-containing protein [Deltaproteobacteria bacterium]